MFYFSAIFVVSLIADKTSNVTFAGDKLHTYINNYFFYYGNKLYPIEQPNRSIYSTYE